jgi:hypothetical protein
MKRPTLDGKPTQMPIAIVAAPHGVRGRHVVG